MTQPDNGLCADLVAGTFTEMPVGTEEYAAFPSIAPIPGGGLRLVWFQGSDHLSYGTAKTMTATSPDNGESWTPAERYTFGLGYRDPCISTVADRMWLSYFTATQVTPAMSALVRPSNDGGVVWGTPRRVDSGLRSAACSAPLVAAGATLRMPFYGRGVGEEFYSAYMGTSTNGGATWQRRRIADGHAAGRSYSEPWTVVDEQTGRLLVMHRYGEWGEIGLTESADAGQTWTAPRPLFPGTGRPATLLTSTGQLVTIYRDVTSRDAVYAVSHDGGASWDAGKMLMPNPVPAGGGMMYAAPVEIAPGRVYVVVAMETSGVRSRLWHGHLVCEG